MIAMFNAPIGCEWVFHAYLALAGSGIAGEAVLRRSTRPSSPAARPKDEQCKDEHNWADERSHVLRIAWPRPATQDASRLLISCKSQYSICGHCQVR